MRNFLVTIVVLFLCAMGWRIGGMLSADALAIITLVAILTPFAAIVAVTRGQQRTPQRIDVHHTHIHQIAAPSDVVTGLLMVVSNAGLLEVKR